MNRIETIARGICVKGGKVLLCRGRKAGNLYFPGGHIEFGEKGATALEREVLEETGLASKAVAFLGVCEHRFVQNGSEDHAEINLVYALDIPDADPARPVEAKEGWIAFDWIDAGNSPTPPWNRLPSAASPSSGLPTAAPPPTESYNAIISSNSQ